MDEASGVEAFLAITSTVLRRDEVRDFIVEGL